jgi:hypothetical protein
VRFCGALWIFIRLMETRHAHEFISASVVDGKGGECGECGETAGVPRDRLLIGASVAVPLRRRLSELHDDSYQPARWQAGPHIVAH